MYYKQRAGGCYRSRVLECGSGEKCRNRKHTGPDKPAEQEKTVRWYANTAQYSGTKIQRVEKQVAVRKYQSSTQQTQ